MWYNTEHAGLEGSKALSKGTPLPLNSLRQQNEKKREEIIASNQALRMHAPEPGNLFGINPPDFSEPIPRNILPRPDDYVPFWQTHKVKSYPPAQEEKASKKNGSRKCGIIKTPLHPIKIESIYKMGDSALHLPKKMARCTPDTLKAICEIDNQLSKIGGKIVLANLYRTYDMQLQAHIDYVSGKNDNYNPPPGYSMYEAGRAFDLDLGRLNISLGFFWSFAEIFGVFPMKAMPGNSHNAEWHFYCPGSHRRVFDYYNSGNAENMTPYAAMASSAIIAVGNRVDRFRGKEKEAAIQFDLIRLGYDPGDVDGVLGKQSKEAIFQAGISPYEPVLRIRETLSRRCAEEFPQEYTLETKSKKQQEECEKLSFYGRNT